MSRFSLDNELSKNIIEAEKRLQEKYSLYNGVDEDYCHAGEDAIERWLDWKFGIRIHWSLYALHGSYPESWGLVKDRGGTPVLRQQYESMAEWWKPDNFDAEEWADLFVDSGLKFFTFTTKHHDGFSMYDTQTKVKWRKIHVGQDAGKIVKCDLHYSITEGRFGRDITRELVDACRGKGLGIGLYYSHIDWFDSDFRCDDWNYQLDGNYTRKNDPEGFERMIRRHREQLLEICSNYGKIDLLSLDMGFPGTPDELKEKYHLNNIPSYLGYRNNLRPDLIETIKQVRRKQPEVLIRRRGIDPYGDYNTPERAVPDNDQGQKKMPWQVIYPGSNHFSFQWNDEYKSVSWIVRNLIDITAKGGNFQIGYGPGPDGTWPELVRQRLLETGKWLKVNGEGIYATRPYKFFNEGENIRYTRTKDNQYVYAFVMDWHPFCGSITLRRVKAAPGAPITMLGFDHEFEYEQNDNGLKIIIPEHFTPENYPCELPFFAFKIQQAK